MTKTVQPPDNKWTIIDALNWTSGYFASNQIESPRIAAEILLSHALNIRRLDLYLRHDQPLSKEELAIFKKLIKRRITREPVAYITGEREFWSLNFVVTPDTLIPRPETECLVEAVLTCLDEIPSHIQSEHPCRVLDIGTGSGAIILALAAERKGPLYFANDRHMAAITVAKENAEKNGLLGQVLFFAGDWVSAVKNRPLFDVIVSNPPYIPSGIIETLEPEVALFEPKTALDGGKTGLDCLGRIVATAGRCLKPGGHLVMETGYDQRAAMEEMLSTMDEYGDAVFIKDYAGNQRVVRLKKRETVQG